ncbi:LytTR family DNA-binding domain-containing protein [Marinicella sediminis]|uniref:LytTR family DNA-binding domain-containing protein n=1 Tax=Marinicella sediminis TaxID=1792834 RepID=A0ABV7J6J5_9GAMM|nr:LytTR family DNA-binding domain-containing protein [Marinicella sediminis]
MAILGALTKKNRKLILRWMVVSAGVYLALVLNFLEPFGIQLIRFIPVYHVILSSYGLVASLVVGLWVYWIFPRFGLPRWDQTGGQLTAWMTILVILMSISCWAYSWVLHWTISGWHNMYVPVRGFWELTPQFLAMLSIWGLVWLANLLIMRHFQDDRPASELLLLEADNQSDHVQVNPHQLLCFKTCDNYLEMYYLDEANQVQHRLIRSSMKKMAEQLAEQNFVRPHQSYLVNWQHVRGLKKAPPHLSLEMSYLDFDVAVSRKQARHIKTRLTESP